MQREFLESILPSGTTTIWRRAAYGKHAPIDIQKWFQSPEDFEQILSYVQENSNWDVYVSPASYSKESRNLENVKNTSTAWLDADACELGNLRVEPSWKVQSSPGRWQAWWVLDKEYPATDVAHLVKKISYAHRDQGADVSSWAANKLMRVPLSVNSNYGFPTPVTAEPTGAIYSLDELNEAYSDIDVSPPRVSKTGRANSLVNDPGELPDYATVLAELPGNILETATAQVKEGTNRSDLRYRLLCDLFRFGKLSYDEILSVAWHAPASRKWSMEDPRGISGLKFEADKAQYEIEYELEKLANTPRPEESKAISANIKLLTDQERKESDWDCFVEQYLSWSKTKTSVQNEAYDEINAWVALALLYGEKFHIPLENGDQNLNLYAMTLGESTSGKSQAKKRLMKTANEYFKDDPGFNLGGNMSPEALAQKLLERDELSSFINRDEVHGWFKNLVDPRGGYQTGLVEDFAELYDGYLPPILRKSMKGDSGRSAHVCVTMHLMGVPGEVISVLTRDLFKSGFLARFIWSIGNPRNVTKKSLKTKLRTGARVAVAVDDQIKEWIRAADQMRGAYGPRYIELSNVIDRIDEARWDLVRLVPESDPNYDILNPSLTRLGDTVMRCCALLAVADGRTDVELKDVYYTLTHAESWAANLIAIASQISASEFENSCNEIEKFVESRPDKRVSGPTLFNRFKARNPRDFRVQLESLEARGILLRKDEGAKVLYFINQNKED